MATSKTKSDAIGLYLSGGEFANQSQYDQAISLGGYISNVPVTCLTAYITDPIPPIAIESIGGGNVAGTGYIRAATTGTLAYKAPGDSTYGTAVAIANGQTVLLESATAAKSVRVSRDSTDGLSGEMRLDIVNAFNNAIGMGNVAHADRVDGSSTYRGCFIKAHAVITDLKVWRDSNSPIRIATETTGGVGLIQAIADENTEPTGRTWNTGTTSGTGISVASMAANETLGLWIHRNLAAGRAASASTPIIINYQFTYSAVTYTGTWRGCFREADTALALYELYAGEDANPDFVTPVATSATLPFEYTPTLPVSGSIDYRLCVRKRNEYNLVGFNEYLRTFSIDENGDIGLGPVTAPTFSVSETGGGYLRVLASYPKHNDANQATAWHIYTRGDGVNPDPATDTPISVAMTANKNGLTPNILLSYRLGPYADGEEIRVLVTTARGATESANTTPVITAIATITPHAPEHRSMFYGIGYGVSQGTTIADHVVVLDAENSIEARITKGYTDLYCGAEWVWRIRYDSGAGKSEIYTTYTLVFDDIAGAATAHPVEAISATQFYISVDTTRAALVDTTAKTITLPLLDGVADTPAIRTSSPIGETGWNSLLQGYDAGTLDYSTIATFNYDGVLTTQATFIIVDAEGDIP